MASSSFYKYDVFLSFRGEDTRYNFISHLHAALCREKLKTFIDEALDRGDEISPALLNAIERSKISVIIFSKNYAFSKWCLDELVKIFECKSMNGQMAIPIFYHVDPSDVRKQTGSFRDAFIKHEKRFKVMPQKIQNWRAVLTEASNLSGWTSKEIRFEAQLVDVVVKDILKKLENITVSTDSDGLVGLHSQIEQIKSLLCSELPDFQIIGIWGMGGIGKTTIAGAIFNLISRDFEGKCFMANVREESEKGGGLVHLRQQLLYEILKENIQISTPNLPEYIRERLKWMKVFIVLDDVNKVKQVEYLIGGLNRFGLGSRIVITTRDKRILDNFSVHNTNIYEVNGLDYHEALKLFCNFAFKHNHPPDDLLVLSKHVVEYADGNPLALRVLGSFFHQKSKLDWENALENLKLIYDLDIYEVLKISYNELKSEEKSIFLDIACFFAGEDKDFVMKILEISNFVLNVLVDKSLVSISYSNKLQMHDLLQEMGREIVRQESIKEPGKRSRLWNHEDVYHVLKKNKGTYAIEGIFLNMSKISSDIYLDPRTFEKMKNLRLLKFYVPDYGSVPILSSKVCLNQGLEYLPEELRYLHWHEYPLKTLPSNLDPDNLIVLNLPYSQVEKIWEGEKEAFKLKFIDFHHSQNLTNIPEPIKIPNLIKLELSNTAIEEIPSSVECLTDLKELHLSRCTRLKRLPTRIYKLKSLLKLNLHGNRGFVSLLPLLSSLSTLVKINLSDCAVAEIPQDIDRLSSLLDLDLSGNNLKRLPANIGCLSLESLNLSRNNLESVHSSIGCLYSLEKLDLHDNNLESLPSTIGCLSSLNLLDLSGNNFKGLPASMKQLLQLRYLYLSNCTMLLSLPETPLSLRSLYASNCKQLQYSPDFQSCQEELDTSILETLSGRSSYGPMPMVFDLSNCLKLNEIGNNLLEDSQQKFQYMKSSRTSILEEELVAPILFTLCLPGSRIPDWISHRSLFNSTTIQLPLRCGNTNFIGFAVCVVFGSLDACSYLTFVGCKYCFEVITPSETKHIWKKCASLVDKDVVFDSEHILYGFCRCWDVYLPEGDHHTTVSFQFSLWSYSENSYIEQDHKLRCCGVCPVYLNPNETKPNSFALKLATSSERECTEIRNLDDKAGTSRASTSVASSDEEEREPSPKRICREQPITETNI